MSSFCKCKSYSHFFSKNISIYAIFNDQSFNNTLTNNIINFEQLDPGYLNILFFIPKVDLYFLDIYRICCSKSVFANVLPLVRRLIIVSIFVSKNFLYIKGFAVSCTQHFLYHNQSYPLSEIIQQTVDDIFPFFP